MMIGRVLRLLVGSMLVLLLTGASPPTRGPRWVISTDDYPPAARRAKQEGTTRYELDVDASGEPTACRIIKSSGHQALDDRTCELVLKRARFNPARDDAGNAVPGSISGLVGWDLGLVPISQPAYAGFGVTVVFDDAGAVTSCAVTPLAEGFKLTAGMAGLCGRLGNAAAFAALLGRPTAGLVSATYRYWMKSRRFGGRLPTDQPVRRFLAHVVFDTTDDGAITWCEVELAPASPLPGFGDTDMCGPKTFGVTRAGGGGSANDLFVDVIATETKAGGT